MSEMNERIATRLAMSAYHYPPQDNELGFEGAVHLIQQELDQRDSEHAKEIEQLRAEVDALLQGHAGDKGTVQVIGLKVMRLTELLRKAEKVLVGTLTEQAKLSLLVEIKESLNGS